jgi:FAD synthetase
MTKIMVFGTFDVLHKGHINFLKQAKEHGNELVVIVANDSNVFKIKGKNPLYNQEKRKKQIEKINIADAVFIGSSKLENFYNIIKKESPNVICLGYDQEDFNLEKNIKKENLNIKIVRLKPYKEKIYKSSLLKTLLSSSKNRKI